MYPNQSMLDQFMIKNRIQKDPRNICKIVNGQIVLNRFVKEKRKKGLFHLV